MNMLPEIELTVPVPFERQYAASAVSVSPSYERGIKKMKSDVSPEFGAFLINEGELNLKEYINRIFENLLENSTEFQNIYDRLEEYFSEDVAIQALELSIEIKVKEYVEKDDTAWEDWV